LLALGGWAVEALQAGRHRALAEPS
jgi:hypothetical protein